jgi:opacity protein-like surface antigen
VNQLDSKLNVKLLEMKFLKIVAFVLFSVLFVTNTYSQGNFSIHFGPSIPVMDFAADDLDDEDAGGAAVGLNVGLKYVYPLSESGLGFFGGIDFNYNSLKKEVKDDMEEMYEMMGISNLDIKYFKYINVPITAGLNYDYQVDEKTSVFANAGLGLNIFKMTDAQLEGNGQTVTTEMDVSTNIGFRIGGGFLINKKTSIAINYYGLGEHDLDGEVKSSGYSEDLDGKAKIDFVTLTLGFKF